MFRRYTLAAALAAALWLPAAAHAQFPFYGPIAGGYGGYDNGQVYPYFYRVRSIPTPPYFSLHPPVYYGPRIVYRAYGNSPYAYPSWYERQFGNVAPPADYQPRTAEPVFLMNPYVASNDRQQQ